MNYLSPAGVLGAVILTITAVCLIITVFNLVPSRKRKDGTPRKMRPVLLGVPILAVLALISGIVTVTGIQRNTPAVAAVVKPVAKVNPGILPSDKLAGVTETDTNTSYTHSVDSIPVLAWHQVDVGCPPNAKMCDYKGNVETVSLDQFTAEISYLKQNNYQTITAQQYADWEEGIPVKLPSKPILLTFDDGTTSSYIGTTQVLRQFGYNAVTFIVSAFATGATNRTRTNYGWDMSWAQLKALPADVWSFGFHAGNMGHDVTFPNNKGCTYFYPCQLPTETDAQYEHRVSSEITTGRQIEKKELGSRIDNTMWAVPWNDIAQINEADENMPSSGIAPKWLAKWASTQFSLIFIQDPNRNNFEHERYRLEVEGNWSQHTFQTNLVNNIEDGFFDRT